MIFQFNLMFILLLCFQANLKAQDLARDDIQIYQRSGFQKDWLNKAWNKEDSTHIPFIYGNILNVKLSDSKSLPSFYSNKNEVMERTIQIQIPISKVQIIRTPGILISRIGENWEVYHGSQLLESRISKDSNLITRGHTSVNRIYPLFEANSIQDIHIITIRIIGNLSSPRSNFQIYTNKLLGDVNELKDSSNEILPFVLISTFSILGFYLIYLYARMRKYIHVLYFGCFLLNYSADSTHKCNKMTG